MSIIMVEPDLVGYEIIVTKCHFYINSGLLKLEGHYINVKRTPKRVIDMLRKKKVNRVGLYSSDILELGKMNKIKNKPMIMFQWFNDFSAAQKFLQRCNVKIRLQQSVLVITNELEKKKKDIKWGDNGSSNKVVI